ncbi:pimeloyl-ACP methyl ester esterase BioH [Glaciecola sp. 1036]|uniref:pimeloyl-ACP methyl ester esterase BioH n=1 Tax=Alteromonadaceae TaxID=72275 RepID=UPI003D08EE08
MSSKENLLIEGSELNLIFIHGWGMNSGVWRSFQPFLDSLDIPKGITANCHFLDLPGYGNSKHVSLDHYNLAALSEHVESLLPTNTLLIGWSLGGLVATAIALSASQKVVGLINLCSSPKFMQEGNWPGIKPDVIAAFESQLVGEYAQLMKRFVGIQFMGVESQRTNSKEVLNNILDYPAPDKEVLAAGLEILKNTDFRERLGKLDIPQLNIFGRLDSLVPIKVVDEIQQLSALSCHQVIAKASHAPFISHPQEVLKAINGFITESL